MSNYTFDSDSLKYLLNKLKEMFSLKSEADFKVDKVNGKDLVTNDYTDEYAQLNNKIINDIAISDKTDTEITLTFSRKNGDSSSIRIPYDKYKKSALFVDAPEKFTCLANEENKINYRYISSLKDGNHSLVVEIVKSTGANVSHKESYTYDKIPDYYLYVPGEEDIALRMYFIDSENTMTGITYLEPEVACLVAEYILNEINDNAYPNCNDGSLTGLIANDTQNDDNTFTRTAFIKKEEPTKVDFRNVVGLTKINKIGPTITNMANAFSGCINLTGSPVCGDNVTDMNYAYANCFNLTGSPACGNNVTNMRSTYHNCHNLTGQPVCGSHVTDMYCAYYNCNNLYGDMYVYSNTVSNAFHCFYGRNTSNQLTISVNFGTESYNSFTTHSITGYSLNWTNAGNGSIYCWNDEFNIAIFNMQTTNMASAFSYDQTITKAACGPNVTNMTSTYYNCQNLTGSPVCGPNVNTMTQTYQNCRNLTDSPVCGDNVTSMYQTYDNCRNLTGSPVCGSNVTSMYGTYNNCSNITGSPVCGPNVVNMTQTYQNCRNLTGSPVCGDNVTGMNYAYHNCTNLTGSPVCGDNVTNIQGTYYNCRNLTGSPVCGPNITGMNYTYQNCTNLTGSPVCGDKITSMCQTYQGCSNLTGPPVCGPKVTNMYNTYYDCSKLAGPPACGNKVTNMDSTYSNCYNLTGSPICGDSVRTMHSAYYNCFNLTGSPVCGNLVTDMQKTYSNCYNLTGSPVCGNNVTVMWYTYDNCRNLTGSPVCGNLVTTMHGVYDNCTNLTGSPICGPNVTDMGYTYNKCTNLGSNGYFYSDKVTDVYSCFGGRNTSKRLNLYVPANSTTLTTCLSNTSAKSLTGTSMTWTDSVATNGYYYNTSRNIYIYPVANVEQAYKDNEN